MTQPILNPVKLPADLFPAEAKFARCLAEGIPCTVGSGGLPEEEIESGDNANVVRGEVIRFFAYGGDSNKHLVRGSVIDLRGAWIVGTLDLMHANILYALALIGCRFVGPVVMLHAECRALCLNGSHLAKGLVADGLAVKGDVHLRDSLVANGEVSLRGANVDGDLFCVGGMFHNPKGSALDADGVTTKGSVFLSGSVAEGEVRLLGANIGRGLSCDNGKFHNSGGDALVAGQMTTKGNVSMRDIIANGQVRLLNASVGGNLHCSGGVLINVKGDALRADGMRTKGSVNFKNGFVAVGGVNLAGAQIGRDLACEGAYFDDGFDGECANIGNMFGWHGVFGKGEVALFRARAGGLSIDMKSLGMFQFVLRDFVYDHFSENESLQSRIDWLGSYSKDKYPFAPQPYEQAAKVLRSMGKDIDAWDIEREKNRLQRESDGASRIWKFGGWIMDTLKDAVYRPARTVRWALSVMAFGTAVFALADYHGHIVPTHPVVALSGDYKENVAPHGDLRPTQSVTPEYPAFNPLTFSVDVFTPSAVFHQEDSWSPRSGSGDWWSPKDFDFLWLLRLWYWLEIGAGWVLTSLFLLSITGLLRPRQSSGEKG